MISATNFGVTVPNFGYPTCYIQYFIGSPVGSGCVQPVAAFRSIPSTALGMKSQEAAKIAFAPSGFPTGYNNGVFIGFSGTNETKNPVIYCDFGTGNYSLY